MPLDKPLLVIETQPVMEGETKLLHRELRTTRYRRMFTLGDGVDRNSVDAEFADGILKVKLFKTPESKPTTITIN